MPPPPSYPLPKKPRADPTQQGLTQAPPVASQAAPAMDGAPQQGTQNAPQVQMAPPPKAPVDSHGAPTNFTNFARRFAANADVAHREADKYANQATSAAARASASLGAAQTQFANGVNTGSVAPPPGSDAPAATNVGGAIPPSNSGDASSIPANTVAPAAPPVTQGGPSIADMLAKAGQSYTGPAGRSASARQRLRPVWDDGR